jgi:hypothetical protein
MHVAHETPDNIISRNDIVAILVTIEGVLVGNRIY